MLKKRKLKIVFIHSDLGVDEADRLVLDAAGALKRQKHDVVFLTNHFDPSNAFEELKKKKFPVQVYGDWLPRRIMGRCQSLCDYFRMIYLTVIYILFYKKKDKPDLFFIDLIPIAIPFLKLANQKVVYYFHQPDLLASPPGNTQKKFYRKPIDWIKMKATALADVILVNSEHTGEIFKQTFPEIDKPIKILFPAVGDAYLKSVENLKQPKPIFDIVPEIKSRRDDLIVFLCTNIYIPAKKNEFPVAAMEKLKILCTPSQWERFYCIFAGEYNPKSKTNAVTFDALVELTKQKHLEDKIIFLKSPSEQLKVELLTTCTALVYTTLNDHFGVIPLETMVFSKPDTARSSGHPRDHLIPGITRYLCKPNADSLARSMYKLTTVNYKKMGIENGKGLVACVSHETFEKCLYKVVNELVDSTTTI